MLLTSRRVLAVTCLLLLGACSRPTEEAASTPYVAQFALYSAASAARHRLIADGATVSAIQFQGGEWTFRSSVDAAHFQKAASPEASRTAVQDPGCTSESQGGSQYNGNTTCDMYSEAQNERNAMINDGHPCSDIYFEDGKWKFEWFVYPTT